MELATEIEVVKSRLDEHDSSLDKLTDISTSLRDIVMEHKSKIAATQDDIQDLKDTNKSLAKDLKEDTAHIAKNLKEDTEKMFGTFKTDLKEDFKELKEAFTTVGNRITSLEKYRWLLVGGIGISAFIVGLAIEYITGTKVVVHI